MQAEQAEVKDNKQSPRPLKARHFFPFLRFVRAMRIRDAFRDLFEEIGDEIDKETLKRLQREKGFDVMWTIVERIPDAEDEFFEFMSEYLDRSTEDVIEMPMDELISVMRALLQDPRILGFFRQATG